MENWVRSLRLTGAKHRWDSFQPRLERLEERLQLSLFGPWEEPLFTDWLSPRRPLRSGSLSVMGDDVFSEGFGLELVGYPKGPSQGSDQARGSEGGGSTVAAPNADNVRALQVVVGTAQPQIPARDDEEPGVTGINPPTLTVQGTTTQALPSLGALQDLMPVPNYNIAFSCDAGPGVYPGKETNAGTSSGPESTLLWSSYLADPEGLLRPPHERPVEEGFGVAVDAKGYVYVAGTVGTCDITTMYLADYKAFVAKVSPDGRQLLWFSTFRRTGAGVNTEVARGITVNASGDQIFVTGSSSVANTPNSLLSVYKLNGSGGVVGSYFLDHNATNVGHAIQRVGNDLYVTGTVTIDPNLPAPPLGTSLILLKFDTNLVREQNFGGVLYGYATTGQAMAVNPVTREIFVGGTILTDRQRLLVLKVSTEGRPISWAATLGDDPLNSHVAKGLAFAQEAGGAMVYFTGYNQITVGFVQPPLILGKLRDDGNSFGNPKGWPLVRLWSGSSIITQGHGIAVNAAGNAHVVATYGSFNPFDEDFSDAGVFKFGPNGDTLAASDILHLGGRAECAAECPALKADRGSALALVGDSVHVTGTTFSGDFPNTPLVFQPFYGLAGDAFVTKGTI